ncbi:hypothetical protein CIK05_08905 [Bdellovibrio sp. qaytius]|nr:hypothetical protein CIK05_08905 [Bdellovibrio sp. qaytius]
MNEKKLDRAVKCLYAVAAIKTATTIYALLTLSSLSRSLKDLSLDLSTSVDFSIIASTLFFGLGMAILSVVTAQNLREQKTWAWIAAISIFLFSIPSFALPAAVLGALTLFDVEVRAQFIKELDIKL